jgi:hypothetical protein
MGEEVRPPRGSEGRKEASKPYKGTEKDLEQIIDWLLTLKTS